MLEEVGMEICDYTVKNSSLKVNKTNKLKDYLKQYKKYELLYVLTSVVEYSRYTGVDNIIEFIKNNHANNKKQDLIDVIYDNKELIVTKQLRYISDGTFELLKKVVENNGYLTISDIPDIDILFELKKFCILFFEDGDKAILHIPSDIFYIIKSNIFSKGLKNYREKFNKIKELMAQLIEIYGVISFLDIAKLYYNNHMGISLDEFWNMMNIAAVVLIALCGKTIFKNDALFYSIEFDSGKEAIEFYKQIKGDYRVFGKNELKRIGEFTYFHENKSYLELKSFFAQNYGYEDIREFDVLVIGEYIIQSQMDLSKARINLSNMLDEEFEFSNFSEKNKIMKWIDDIRLSYPSWKLKGRIPIEEK